MKNPKEWFHENKNWIYMKGHGHKDCCCGWHSHKDVKKNLNHHSTKMKFLYRQERKFKSKQHLINF